MNVLAPALAPAAPHGDGALLVTVARRWQEAEGVLAFELVARDGGDLPAFEPGAHIDVHAAPGLVRSYSLCNDAAERHRYVIGVLRTEGSRGGSAAMHDKVGEGDLLAVSRPRNHFPLDTAAARHLLVAGGIGLTPLLCMARRLAHAQADFTLHYAARSPRRAAFLAALADAPLAPRTCLHFDDGPAAQRFDALRTLRFEGAGTHLYVCGPQGFMDHVIGTAVALGWPVARIHRECFAGPRAHAHGRPFEIELARSGRIVPVPAGVTALDALLASGIAIPSACGEGVCGTCLTPVLGGEVDHRDAYLTPQERAAHDQFLPCCSRALSPRLVIDA